MEVIEWHHKQASRSDRYHIYPIGDCHLGAIEAEEDGLRAKVKSILEDPNAYVIGMGDYSENIAHNDPRFDSRNIAPWVEPGNIYRSQAERVKEIFGPLAKEKRIICMLTGNHEEAIHLRQDDDVTRNLCKDLDVPYAGYQCFVHLYFNAFGRYHGYTWHAWHGAGSAQSEGARLMRLLRLVSDIEADIYTMGHLHGALTSHTPDRLRYDTNTQKIRSVKVIATLSGSWVKGFMQSTEERPINSGYGERAGYKPARIGCPMITLYPENKGMELTS